MANGLSRQSDIRQNDKTTNGQPHEWGRPLMEMKKSCLELDGCFEGVDVHTTASAIESDIAVDERIKGVVTSAADIAARMELGANLANDDAARGHQFTAKTLDAKTLCVAVATVAAAALAFLMCHDRILML